MPPFPKLLPVPATVLAGVRLAGWVSGLVTEAALALPNKVLRTAAGVVGFGAPEAEPAGSPWEQEPRIRLVESQLDVGLDPLVGAGNRESHIPDMPETHTPDALDTGTPAAAALLAAASDREHEPTSSKTQDDLPVAGYDQLTLGSLRTRLSKLSAAELGDLRDYESAHGKRLPVLQMLENRLAKLTAGPAAPGRPGRAGAARPPA